MEWRCGFIFGQQRPVLVALLVLCLLWVQHDRAASQPGFLSLDCGGNSSFTDARTGIQWQPDAPFISIGASDSVVQTIPNTSLPLQYQKLRSFTGSPGSSKICYTLPVNASQRYLVRATFLYANYDGKNTAPEFQLFVNVTLWSDVRVADSNRDLFEDVIVLSTGSQLDVCMIRGAAGVPFISTLELRQLIGSMYSASYETRAHLKHIARVDFGALTTEDVRYPDDIVDRRWQSDLTRPNNLAREAPGTIRVSTNRSIGVSSAPERPPEKVMQTAVVGSLGNLTYRYLIPEFPGFAFGKTYLAEVQNLRSSDVRAFTFLLPNDTLFRNQVVNLVNDIGAFQAYEPGYDNVSLRQIINFGFQKTAEANLGPILNAMEILKIVNKQAPTLPEDVGALGEFIRSFRLSGPGDPCIPATWDWVTCSNLDTTPRITGLDLSGRNLSGAIPSAIAGMTSLINIDLSNNSLSGPLPDLSQLSSLKELHLENNKLTGDFPGWLAGIGSLQELYVENNMLTGSVPGDLLSKPGLDFQYSGNPGLCVSNCRSKHSKTRTIAAIVGGVVGGLVLLCLVAAAVFYFFCFRKEHSSFKSGKKNPSTNNPDSFTSMISTYQSHASDSGNILQEQGSETQAHRFTFQELKEASNNFSTKVGSGGFGTVYYGKLKTGAEVAIKVLSSTSHQGTREFHNEVTLLSRIHHRNLVSFLGYCQEGKERVLVYEFMHVGTLRDCLYGISDTQHLDWKTRIRVLLDAAKGLDYLHTGCNPSIIHRDVKSSNILISDKKIGKVSDFGLSKMTSGETSLVSTTVKGTVGYLDPEYYMNQRLTEKSDVYSFGIVLLETISAREPLNPQLFEPESNIVQWARVALQKGNIKSIADSALGDNFLLESMWKVAEAAMYCVEPYGVNRPSMNEVVRELQEAYDLEGAAELEDPTNAGASSQSYEELGGCYHLADATRNPMQSINISSVFAEPHAR